MHNLHDSAGAEYGPGYGVSRSRNIRTISLAAGVLVLFWLLGTSSLFHRSLKEPVIITGTATSITPQTESVNDSTPSVTPIPQPASMAGDDFYTDDALSHFAPPPPEPAAPPPTPEALVPEPAFQDNVAVIMETDPSKVPSLIPIMTLFMNILGPKWPIVLLTLQDKWVEPDSPQFKRAMASNQIRIMFLPPEATFPDHHSVSVFLTSPWIWEQFETANRVLMFQADSVLCSKSKLVVEDFVQYDLVGAPIGPKHGFGFNGGLSLRNPKLFLEIARDPAYDFLRDSGHGESAIPNEKKFEDQWFYMRLKERGANLPDVSVAKTFAVETVYYETPLGYHQPARWQAAKMKQIYEWCPEVGMIQKSAQHFY